MPTYAIEFKSFNSNIKEAKLQYAFNRSIITKGALAKHKYIKKPNNNFFNKTQVLTLAFNSRIVEYYSYYAL